MKQREILGWIRGHHLRMVALFFFASKISLIIKNEDSLPIDTDECKKPFFLSLDVRGKVELFKLLKVEPVNPKLALNLRDDDDRLILEHAWIGLGESLKMTFLAWFAVNMNEL